MIDGITFWFFEVVNCTVLLIVYLRFDMARKFLTLKCSVEESRTLIKKLRAVSGILDATCDAMESIKLCFSINMINYVLQYTFMLTYSAYSIISYAFHDKSFKLDLIYMLMAITWTLTYTPKVLFLFWISNAVNNKEKSIEDLVRTIQSRNISDLKLQRKAELLILQFEHRKPLLSCGLFSIDWYLLFYLLGTSYSYVLIIIQFELHTYSE
jgi:gustatory receptor